ncbi:hypothetical protein LTWDN19_00790 [Latilactobacillus curvatus]|uniref:Lipoprotein n=1 Tax=Latilactobacillus curvatus TaxID=28038 RepID=A0ABN6GF89_LATCU|nr:hypothetical protein [Latilactobacillus curvatus]BCX29512.1 hypothetical protein LTWDN19_00790 [Latilactobacillus curvatus]
MKIEVELDKYHLIASLLTVAAACAKSDDPETNKTGEFVKQTARELWEELPKDYRHTVELEKR